MPFTLPTLKINLQSLFIFYAFTLPFPLLVSQPVAIVLIGYWAYFSIRRKSAGGLLFPVGLLFSLFLFFRFISFFFSVEPALSLFGLKKIFFYLVFFSFLDLFDISDRENVARLLQAFMLSTILSIAAGTIQLFMFHYISEKPFLFRLSALTSGYGTYGTLLTVIFAIFMNLGREKTFFRNRILWFVFISFTLVSIFFTYNRMNWIAVGIILLTAGLLWERRPVLLLIAVCSLFFLSNSSLRQRLLSLRNPVKNSSERTIIWKSAKEHAWKKPLTGYGLNTFSVVFDRKEEMGDKGVGSWHNDFIQVYLESGVFALIFFTLIPLSAIYCFISVLRKRLLTDGFTKNLFVSFFTALLVFYLHSFTGGFTLDSMLFMFFCVILAIYFKYYLFLTTGRFSVP